MDYFLVELMFTTQLRRYKKFSCIPPAPTHACPSPLSISLTRMVHLLQLMTLNGHITITLKSIITHSSLWFTLSVVHFMGLDRYMMTCTQHFDIMWSSFTVLKILCDNWNFYVNKLEYYDILNCLDSPIPALARNIQLCKPYFPNTDYSCMHESQYLQEM